MVRNSGYNVHDGNAADALIKGQDRLTTGPEPISINFVGFLFCFCIRGGDRATELPTSCESQALSCKGRRVPAGIGIRAV